MAVLLVGLTAFAPGLLRLTVMQPLRDAAMFYREVQPLTARDDIEIFDPAPTRSLVLPGSDTHLEIALDLWVPERSPAPAVLLLHGSSPRGRMLGFNRLLASRLQQDGWLVLTPDARGFGDSGTPATWRKPAAWSVAGDLERLADYARRHPDSNGTLAVVGHSLGASHLLQLDLAHAEVSAMVLMGPARQPTDRAASWSERVRYGADRGFLRLMPQEVVDLEYARAELQAFARAYRGRGAPPLLLLDGEQEGSRLIEVLDRTAETAGDGARRVTIPGSNHYCGAYQLPWPFQDVFVRQQTFDRCFAAVSTFLHTHATPPDGA